MSRMLKLVFAGFLWFLPFIGEAQNLDKLSKPKEIANVSGGASYSANFMDSYGKALGRDPFIWSLSGNISFSILDIALPFSYTFTNQGGAYTQPFNFVGLHPTYKKFKSHIGNFSMALSPYTLSGLTIAGAGLEYGAGKWKFQGLGGRFQRKVLFEEGLNNAQNLAFTRWGGGLSASYEAAKYSAQLVLMKVQDDPNSLLFIPNASALTAKDNFATSIKLKGNFIKDLSTEFEISNSTITLNRGNTNPFEAKGIQSVLGKLVAANQSTTFYKAINGTIGYKIKTFNIGAKYERIDPGYTTMGGMFFNNDLENISLTPSLTLFKGKLSLATNVGIQRNNLDNTANADNKRWIGSVNLSCSAIKNVSLSASYTNMSSFTRRNPGADPFFNLLADTLNVYQISNSSSFSASYAMGQTVKSSFMFSAAFSESENITGRLENAAAFGLNTQGINTTPSNNINAMFGHNLSFTKSKATLGWSFNATNTKAGTMNSLFVGPGVNASKPIEKLKISLNGGLTYNQNYTNKALTNHILTARLGMGYQPKLWDKKFGTLGTNLSASLVNRLPTGVLKTTRDFMLILGLNYGF